MGCEVAYLNVGGGLGVDYDGSKTASEFSVNYSLQEFANDVIYVVGEVCDNEEVPVPAVVTESGRAMVAYHSLLVTDVKKVIAPGAGALYALSEIESQAEPVLELTDLARDINGKNFREYYHDAIQQREDLNALFELGYLDLEDKAKGEWLFWKVCRQAAKLSRAMEATARGIRRSRQTACGQVHLQLLDVSVAARFLGLRSVVPDHADSPAE